MPESHSSHAELQILPYHPHPDSLSHLDLLKWLASLPRGTFVALPLGPRLGNMIKNRAKDVSAITMMNSSLKDFEKIKDGEPERWAWVEIFALAKQKGVRFIYYGKQNERLMKNRVEEHLQAIVKLHSEQLPFSNLGTGLKDPKKQLRAVEESERTMGAELSSLRARNAGHPLYVIARDYMAPHLARELTAQHTPFSINYNYLSKPKSMESLFLLENLHRSQWKKWVLRESSSKKIFPHPAQHWKTREGQSNASFRRIALRITRSTRKR